MTDYLPSQGPLFHTVINAAAIVHKFKQKDDIAGGVG